MDCLSYCAESSWGSVLGLLQAECLWRMSSEHSLSVTQWHLINGFSIDRSHYNKKLPPDRKIEIEKSFNNPKGKLNCLSEVLIKRWSKNKKNTSCEAGRRVITFSRNILLKVAELKKPPTEDYVCLLCRGRVVLMMSRSWCNILLCNQLWVALEHNKKQTKNYTIAPYLFIVSFFAWLIGCHAQEKICKSFLKTHTHFASEKKRSVDVVSRAMHLHKVEKG